VANLTADTSLHDRAV